MTEKTPNLDKFNLDLPAQNNYINMILQDMKNYQYISDQRHERGIRWYIQGLLAIKHLYADMPPKGKDFILKEVLNREEFDTLKLYKEIAGKCGEEEAWELLDEIYNRAIGWLWPNLLEMHIYNIQPRVKQTAKIGVSE